jgi:DNA polymerase III subunit epsilon
MLISAVDTETTGLDPGDHRIIEAFAGLYDTDTRKKVDQFYTLIDPQRSIPIESQRIHHITPAMLIGKPIWDFVAEDFRKFVRRGKLFVAHNADFDERFINYELQRIKLPTLNLAKFDTMLQGRWATWNGAVPNLGALCFACGVDYDTTKAHGAEYDVDVMMQCFFKALDWGFITLPTIEETALAA